MKLDAHCQNRPTDFCIVGWKVGQEEVTVCLNRISCNTLFEVLFKQRQMPVGQTVTQAWAVGEEGFRNNMSTPMHSNAAEEAINVPIGV